MGGVDLKACFCAVRYTRNGVYDGDDEAGDSRMIDV